MSRLVQPALATPRQSQLRHPRPSMAGDMFGDDQARVAQRPQEAVPEDVACVCSLEHTNVGVEGECSPRRTIEVNGHEAPSGPQCAEDLSKRPGANVSR